MLRARAEADRQKREYDAKCRAEAAASRDPPLRCAVQNESWGVGGWLRDAGLLDDAPDSERQRLAELASRGTIMKLVHADARVRGRLKKLVPASRHAQFDAALAQYAARFLVRHTV